jgi:hypothetical protein
MVKNELLAAWTYRCGELAQQRLIQKMGGWPPFGRLLFLAYRKLATIKAEEVLVTTAKIITEKKTWVLFGENRQLTHIRLHSRPRSVSLLFKVQEKRAHKTRSFTVTLPIPSGQLALGNSIYQYFVEWLAPNMV